MGSFMAVEMVRLVAAKNKIESMRNGIIGALVRSKEYKISIAKSMTIEQKQFTGCLWLFSRYIYNSLWVIK